MKKTFALIGIALSIALIIAGIATRVPEKEISFFSFDDNGYEEYVGGDAYNFIIEAALRGGEISGAKTQRAVFITGGALLFTICGLFGFSDAPTSKEPVKTVEPITHSIAPDSKQEIELESSSDKNEMPVIESNESSNAPS